MSINLLVKIKNLEKKRNKYIYKLNFSDEKHSLNQYLIFSVK